MQDMEVVHELSVSSSQNQPIAYYWARTEEGERGTNSPPELADTQVNGGWPTVSSVEPTAYAGCTLPNVDLPGTTSSHELAGIPIHQRLPRTDNTELPGRNGSECVELEATAANGPQGTTTESEGNGVAELP
jgi:hypothetical protein